MKKARSVPVDRRRTPVAVILMEVFLLLGWLWSGAAPAVGLGDLRTLSVQGEPLLAEIELRAPEYPRLQGVGARLAPLRAFERAGAPRPTDLEGLRFQPMVLPSGDAVIRVTSREPLPQQGLRFLVELTWPSGRMVREYSAEPAEGPIQLPIVESVETKERKPEPPTEQPARAPSTHAGSAEPPVGGWTYGPVKRRDTLWDIALGMPDRSEPIPVIVQRLFAHNPEAFIRGDINRLKIGYELRLPAENDSLAPPDGAGRGGQGAKPVRLAVADADPGASAPAGSAEAAELPADGARPETKSQPDAASAPEPNVSAASQGSGPAGHRLALFAAPQPIVAEPGPRARSATVEQRLLLEREEKLVAQQQAEELRRQVEALSIKLAETEQALAMVREEGAMAAQRLQLDHAEELQALAVMEAQFRQSQRISRNERVLFGTLVGLGLVIVVLGIILGTLFRRPARPSQRPDPGLEPSRSASSA